MSDLVLILLILILLGFWGGGLYLGVGSLVHLLLVVIVVLVLWRLVTGRAV
jgi:hypothetical protein